MLRERAERVFVYALMAVSNPQEHQSKEKDHRTVYYEKKSKPEKHQPGKT